MKIFNSVIDILSTMACESKKTILYLKFSFTEDADIDLSIIYEITGSMRKCVSLDLIRDNLVETGECILISENDDDEIKTIFNEIDVTPSRGLFIVSLVGSDGRLVQKDF